MSISGIQGLPLEVTVVGCCNLDNKEWLSRQDPYVCLEYGGTRFRTKTDTDGGRNPTFQEKFIFTLIEGLQELHVSVWNNRTLSADEHIGTGRIQLHKALSQGYDDAPWPLQTKTGRHSGEVRLILHFINSKQQKTKVSPSAPQYATPPPGLSPVVPYYSMPTAPYPGTTAYFAYPPNPAAYPPTPYPQMPPAVYPPQPCPPAGYPVPHYPPPPQPSSYYPPGPAAVYPPPPQPSSYYPPGPAAVYPPPPVYSSPPPY